MKALIAVLLLTAIVGCGGSTSSSPQSAIQSSRAGIVFVGDSIFGRLTSESDFNRAGYFDAGVFGERTDQVLARFQNVLDGKNVCHGYNPPEGMPPDPEFPYVCADLPNAPSTVVIMAGWNDLIQGEITNTVSSLQQMVTMARSEHVRVVICTLYAWDTAHPADWMQPTGNAPVTFYDMWRVPLNDSIRHMDDVTVVDIDHIFVGQANYTIDGIHPTFGTGDNEMLNAITLSLINP